MARPTDPTTMALKLASRGGLPPQTVPVWRTEPYRVLFPMGMLLAWAGVLHWFLHAVGVTPYYGSVFHSITQIQGFMMCFAVGFLFTMVPRRTGTAGPSAWQMAVAIAAPAATSVSAWFELWWLSQILRDYLARVGHLCAAVLLVLSFWTETFSSLRGGLALRAVVVAALLLTSSKAWRLPRHPGWHRKLVWLAAWMIPLGYALAAIFPAEKKAGLHVVFIGGFALMAFSVGVHVVLAHGGFQRLLNGRPWQVVTFGLLFLIAMALRAMVDFDRHHFFLWLGAAAVFLLGTLFWAWLVFPRIWTRSDTV